MSLSGKLAIFILASLVSLHCNIYKNIEKLAKISADEYFLCEGY